MLRDSDPAERGFVPVPIQNSDSVQDRAILPDRFAERTAPPSGSVGKPCGMQHASWDAVPVSDQMGQAAEVAKLVRVSGSVTIIRANGSALDAKRGDLVHLGDMVQTAADGAAGIAFPDGTIFNLAASGRIAVSEFLYDPSGTSNAALVNVIQGTFAYIAGKVAATALYGVRDMHAMGGDAVLDNDTIDPTDQDDKPHGKYGTYVLLSREDPSQVLGVVDNPDIVLVLRAKGSQRNISRLHLGKGRSSNQLTGRHFALS